jgi:L-phenylalanine/L-methionine N-acetyltransferase
MAYGSPHAFAIRRRLADDDAALLELFNEERFQHFGTALERFDSVQDLRAWLESLGAAKFEIVVDVGGKAIGYGRLQPFSDRQSHSGWIFLGVCEAFQRRGIGSALLRSLLATADILAGLQRIQLTVFSDNDVAIELYRRFGFEMEGRHRRFLRRGTWFVDAFTMARICDAAGVAASKEEALLRIQGMLEL